MADNYLSLDFEVGSVADLKKVGAHTFAQHPSTFVLCACWAIGSGPVQSWAVGEPLSNLTSLAEWVRGGKVRAHNAVFEWLIWNHVFVKVLVDAGFGFIPLKLSQLDDTMARCAYWGLPLSLEEAAAAHPGVTFAKDMEGRRIMLQLTKPRKHDPRTGQAEWWHETDPEKLIRVTEYCAQDVRTERALSLLLPPLPDEEQRTWVLDAKINNRGIYLDRDLTDAMQSLARIEGARLDKEMQRVTGGAVPSWRAVKVLTDWCNARDPGLNLTSLAKDVLPDLVNDGQVPPDVRTALAIRQEAAKSSVAKLNAMEAYASADGYMRGLTQYYGAFRTGRWAGRGPQVQNYPRSLVEDQTSLVRVLKARFWRTNQNYAGFLKIIFGVTPLEALSSALRGCLSVGPGFFFAAIDFAQIEARVLAWLAGEEHVIEAFLAGTDLYVLAASRIYGVPIDQVTKAQRQIGKVAVLALGYQGGIGAFQSMAANYGVVVSDQEADAIKNAYRNGHLKIKAFWYDMENAAKDAIRHPGGTIGVKGCPRIAFKVWQGHLCMRLPSGRVLVYRDVKLVDDNDGWGPKITYMGVDQHTRKWTRLNTYGGKLVENACQAVARDALRDAMLRVEQASLPGVELLGSIHDEVLFQLAHRNYFNTLLVLMKRVPDWAHGLPLDASGYVSDRFRKD